ncbi:MAG TPA: hypothetical protein VK574_04240 [Terracidiphilus sp.]|nr:hypothetical protein [Terracidiphilus sp.]
MPKTFRMSSGFSEDDRGIGFLEDKEDKDLDAGAVFDGLKADTERKVRSRMDHWLQGNVYDKYFHRWNLPEYRYCFEFKWEERHKPQRLYGFLCHPIPISNPSFELCVLTFYGVKDDDTDFGILDDVNRLRNHAETTKAISETYPEYARNGRKEWVQ